MPSETVFEYEDPPNIFNEEIELSVQVEADNTEDVKEKLLIKK